MSPIERKGYSCSFCQRKKIYTRKSRVVEHEDRCIFNPKNKACATCKYYAFSWQTKYVKSSDPGSMDYDFKEFFCNPLNEELAAKNNDIIFDRIHDHTWEQKEGPRYNCEDHEIRPKDWVMTEI